MQPRACLWEKGDQGKLFTVAVNMGGGDQEKYMTLLSKTRLLKALKGPGLNMKEDFDDEYLKGWDGDEGGERGGWSLF